MRKTVLFLLAASVAVPSMSNAQSRDREDRDERRAERRAERAAERSERSEPREVRVERSEPREVRVERSEPRQVQVERGGSEPQARVVRDSGERRAVQVERRGRTIQDVREVRREPGEAGADRPRRSIAIGDTVRVPRVRDGGGALVQDREGSTTPERLRDRHERRIERVARGGDVDGRNPPAVSRVPREGTQPPVREARRGDRNRVHRWDGNWRRDGRYDWRRWRDRNRSRFHLGIYFDPFGWGYRPYRVGWRMWPHYYRSNYWLSDSWSYRLPYAPPGYRWIRYYDDAVLVDTWDGQVVDVIYNFFW